jgi:opacity protein-like surface antigen
MRAKTIRHHILALCMIAAFSAGLPDSAAADSRDYRNYGEIRLGINEFTGDLDDAGYDLGGNFAFAYGRYLMPNLIIEGALDLFGNDAKQRDYSDTVGNYTREDSLAVLSLLATIKGAWPVGPVTLFAGGGAGFYLVAVNSEISPDQYRTRDEDDTDSVLGLHVVAGANYSITPRFFVGVQGLYRWTGDIEIDEIVASVPVRVEGNLNGYALTLTAGFRF